MSNVNDLKYIDCHSHPHDTKFEGNTKFLEELLETGGATIAIGTDYENIKKAIEISKKWPNIWATIGIHPADNHNEIFSEEKFKEFLKEGGKKVVAIGECGLDYFYFDRATPPNLPLAGEEIMREKDRQKKLFVNQIEFAIKHNLPLVIHGRPTRNSMDAYRDILDILEEYSLPHLASPYKGEGQLQGHAHFFVGNLEIAKRFLVLGFLMSYDGPITFSTEYDEVIKFLPIENIMIETDSPYAAPAKYRGQINYPHYVVEVAKKIAELKNISLEEVLEITKQNTIKLFKLDQ